MRIRDSLVTTAAAALTSALILTLVGSAPLDAALPEELQLPPAPLPTLRVGEVELTVEGELEGDSALARIVAVNRSDKPARATTQLVLMAQGPQRPAARMVSMPMPAWSEPCVVQLEAGETREIEIMVDALPRGQEGHFVLSHGREQIASRRFAPEGFQRIAFEVEPELDVELF